MKLLETSPKVSVVMPVFNGEKYLSEAIESILKQTFSDFEFVIVDDASTDDSRDVIREYKKIDNRIQIFTNQRNLGIARTTNRGIEKAIGKFIALMDQDDISLPQRFLKQVTYLEEHLDISVVGSSSYNLINNSQLIPKPVYFLSPGLIRWGLLFNNHIQNSTVMMRSVLFKKENFRYDDLAPSQDYSLWMKLNHRYWFSNLPEKLHYHRIHSDNTSIRLRYKYLPSIITIKKKFIHDYFDVEYPEEIILGLSNFKNINNINQALAISSLVYRWQKASQQWALPSFDNQVILSMSKKYLRNIWKFQFQRFLKISN